jgi:hypothetical protein
MADEKRLPEDVEGQDSNPNAGGPQRLEGDMGVSSERVGETGPGQTGTDGVRAPADRDELDPARTPDTEPDEQRPGGDEPHPEGLTPKAGYPERDPRSDA